MPRASIHRRRLLRQLGLRLGDLDPIGRLQMDQVCRLLAKQDLHDAAFAKDPELHAQLAVSLANSAMRAIGKLDRHLAQRKPASPLQRYLEENHRA